MELFCSPIEEGKITQTFGEHDVCCKTRPGGFPVMPFQVVNKVNGVCPQGSRDFYSVIGLKGHNGVDVAAWNGEPTYHCGLYKGWAQTPPKRPNGQPDTDGGVNVISYDPVLACTAGCPPGTMHHVLTRYAHGVMIGKDGDTINPGTYVQKAGDLGSSTGTHVHWAPKWSDEKGNVLHLDNGYEGAFDPAPYFTGVFVLDYLKRQRALPPEQQHPVLSQVFMEPRPIQLSTAEMVKKTLFQAIILIQRFIGLITTA